MTLMMTLVLIGSAIAGCAGNDVDLDDADGGYTYANVDNHRMLMGDVCDIKDLSGAYDWDGVKDIYEDGKYAESLTVPTGPHGLRRCFWQEPRLRRILWCRRLME